MNHCEEGVHNCEERGAQLGGAPAERELRGGEQRDEVRGEGYKHLHEEGYKHLRTRDAQRVGGRVERAWRVKRSEIGTSGAAWLHDRGLPVGSETLSLSSRVPRAASRLQMQPGEPVGAR